MIKHLDRIEIYEIYETTLFDLLISFILDIHNGEILERVEIGE